MSAVKQKKNKGSKETEFKNALSSAFRDCLFSKVQNISSNSGFSRRVLPLKEGNYRSDEIQKETETLRKIAEAKLAELTLSNFYVDPFKIDESISEDFFTKEGMTRAAEFFSEGMKSIKESLDNITITETLEVSLKEDWMDGDSINMTATISLTCNPIKVDDKNEFPLPTRKIISKKDVLCNENLTLKDQCCVETIFIAQMFSTT